MRNDEPAVDGKCGAKAKSTGRPCKNKAGFRTDHLGTGRCWLHGGLSTGPKVPDRPFGNTRAMKHGIYLNAIRPEEKEEWERIPVEDLEDEIKLIRLRIRRLLDLENKIEDSGGFNLQQNMVGFRLMELKQFVEPGEDGSPVTRQETIRKRPDYSTELNRMIGRLGDLVSRQAALNKENPEEDAQALAQALFDAQREMNDTVPVNDNTEED